MRIVVIDSQGGGVGSRLIALLKPRLPQGHELIAAGTNALSTSAMLKAGAQRGATGENAVIWNAAHAGLILGPIGIILANAMLGEISPAVATAVSGADAHRILIPSPACGTEIVGTEELRREDYLRLAVEAALRYLSGQ